MTKFIGFKQNSELATIKKRQRGSERERKKCDEKRRKKRE